jgi:predicted signal transduction protein with EAL and GGDEF domain
VTCSIGIASFPHDGTDADTLLRNADTAMYRAKDLGRNTFQLYSAEMNANLDERLTLETDPLECARAQRVRPLLPAQGRPRDGAHRRPGGAAALASPTKGMILPDRFIPIAEESSLIVEIGNWVLHEACAQAARGRTPKDASCRSPSTSPDARSTTVSRTSCARRSRAANLPPHCLEIELTESARCRTPRPRSRRSRSLRDWASESRSTISARVLELELPEAPARHRLKIDQSFVRDLVSDPDDRRSCARSSSSARSSRST